MQDIFIAGQALLPTPPSWLLTQALEALAAGQPTQAALNNWPTAYTERTLIKSGVERVNAFNHSIFLDDAALAWARSNISPEVIDIRLVFTRSGLESSGPHTDGTRARTLIYLLETGGPNHQTVFYQERNCAALERPPAYRVDDYSQLDVIYSLQLAVDTWTLLNATVIHSVENISQGRLSLQISLPAGTLDNEPILKRLR